jgi:hypothetical protein
MQQNGLLKIRRYLLLRFAQRTRAEPDVGEAAGGGRICG